MKKKSKKPVIKFGEDVDGYSIPVLNEREIRASAGIIFLLMFVSLMLVLFKGNFLLIKYVLVLFLTDLLIRVFINPRFSPFLIIGRLIVIGQVPEYVGAAQKKFAWKIGVALSGLMFILLVLVNSYSIFTGVTCFLCLAFLFFESAFGICLGCFVYGLFYRDETKYCAGNICDRTSKHEIQKVSFAQFVIILCFIGYITLAVLFLNSYFNESPREMWEIISAL